MKNQQASAPSSTNLNHSSSSNFQLHQPIPNFQKITSRINQEINHKLNQEKGQESGTGKAASKEDQVEAEKRIVLLDLKSALLCSAREEVVRPVLRSLLEQVKEEIEKV